MMVTPVRRSSIEICDAHFRRGRVIVFYAHLFTKKADMQYQEIWESAFIINVCPIFL